MKGLSQPRNNFGKGTAKSKWSTCHLLWTVCFVGVSVYDDTSPWFVSVALTTRSPTVLSTLSHRVFRHLSVLSSPMMPTVRHYSVDLVMLHNSSDFDYTSNTIIFVDYLHCSLDYGSQSGQNHSTALNSSLGLTLRNINKTQVMMSNSGSWLCVLSVVINVKIFRQLNSARIFLDDSIQLEVNV